MKQLKMLEFLKEYLSFSMVILEVVEMKLLDYDSEYGLAGEAYHVKLLEKQPDLSNPNSYTTKNVERNCIVNALEFNSWVRKKYGCIKFID